jgi:hypothetical protein
MCFCADILKSLLVCLVPLNIIYGFFRRIILFLSFLFIKIFALASSYAEVLKIFIYGLYML